MKKEEILKWEGLEVKGSTNEKGSITLKGNELEKAQDKRENYFLYRVYQNTGSPGTFELVSLKDPLGCSEALDRKMEINPFHTEESECFELESADESNSSENT
ncbi:hypothetical protein AKJ65_07170 [candidate division MSBL1 archaeon SCGC-AAA259E19]|uniref:Protein NO VEIN C-terminal domain-containing protein n=1 Tax=candidate division MSBL1 archaeon SCGC-AAA259E19 TaxID=1698264 RepID=A0A133UEX3_9EURY|nr:hypothetical protein AKJ65_07170 [candidate division MSBL1 archaeon SCGC-AAA259E19]